jgi:hypothetical protein
MKLLLLFTFSVVGLAFGYAQSNRVFSGMEIFNYGILDISLNGSSTWTSERSSQPGYYCALENAIYIGYSDDSNIDGYIKKYGNTAFVFPVGNGKDLRTLEISKPNQLTDAYATAWIEGDPSRNLDPTTPYAGEHPVTAVEGNIIVVSKTGQWDWQVGEAANLSSTSTGNGAGLLLTVSIPDMTAFADADELRLVGWNGSSWVDLSAKPTATGNKEDSKLSGTMIAGISAIGIGKIESVPFIKLDSISASSSFCMTNLKWTTSFENNSSLFLIEQSRDGFSFYTTAAVPSSGLFNGHSYSKDLEQPPGLIYFRLKMLNNKSAYKYSQTVSVNNKCNETNEVRLFPNPVSNKENIHLRFTTSYEGEGSLTIVNTMGQKVFEKSVQITPGTNLVSTDVKRITHGIYFIKIMGANGEQIVEGRQFFKE